jgi:hypothetical protein
MIDGDAMDIVHAMSKEGHCWNTLYGQLIAYAKTMLHNFRSYLVRHVKGKLMKQLSL